MTRSQENPWAGQGSVLLDIGDDVGAVVVEMPREMEGLEVEARRMGREPARHDHMHHPHVEVLPRPIAQGLQASLVFPALESGDYGLGLKGVEEVHLTASVRGGEVTWLRWPE